MKHAVTEYLEIVDFSGSVTASLMEEVKKKEHFSGVSLQTQ